MAAYPPFLGAFGLVTSLYPDSPFSSLEHLAKIVLMVNYLAM